MLSERPGLKKLRGSSPPTVTPVKATTPIHEHDRAVVVAAATMSMPVAAVTMTALPAGDAGGDNDDGAVRG